MRLDSGYKPAIRQLGITDRINPKSLFSNNLLPRRPMAGHRSLDPRIMVRIHAGQFLSVSQFLVCLTNLGRCAIVVAGPLACNQI